MPDSRRKPSRSTTSCALRTQVAGSPPVSGNDQLHGPAEQPAFGVDLLGPEFAGAAHLRADPADGPVSATGMPILIGSIAAAKRGAAVRADAAIAVCIAARREMSERLAI